MKKTPHNSTLRAWTWVPSLYFAEGLPYVAVMTVCNIMYKRMGISNAEIAFFTAWLYLPWVIKPFWSPIVDVIGSKRRWVVAMQLLMGLGFGAVALSLSLPGWFAATLSAFWIVAFLSATHDIAADGLYMLGLSQKNQSLFVGIRTVFYRLALIAGQGGLVVVAGWLEKTEGVKSAWQISFALVSLFFVIASLYHYIVLPHPQKADNRNVTSVKQTIDSFFDSFRSFFTKPGIGVALLFMLLYRFPEAQLVKLITPFLLDSPAQGGLGLSTLNVGMIYGTVGTIGLMAGGVIGGYVVSKGGLKKWMMPMAWSMSLTCLTFVYLAFIPQQPMWVIMMCVAVEQIGYGFGGTAYMLYLIYFSQGKWQTSHYAMCTGIMALGMMIPGMWAGWLQQTVGYDTFFIYTVCCCALTIRVAKQLKIPENYI